MEHATLPILVLLLTFAAFILVQIFRAKRGANIQLRRIAGLEVIEDAVGRATEQDRPIMFNPGFGGISVELFCSLAVMTNVVKKAAKLSMPVYVPISDPLAYAMAEEYWKDGYSSMGAEGMYAPEECIRYLSGNQSAYAAGIAGWVKRENVGAQFLFGPYGYEAMILAEAGQQVGAIQVACTTAFNQVPFFIVSCDYTVFGEEFYAAGAYFSKDPVLTGSLVGQDWSKLIILFLIIVGCLIYTFAQQDFLQMLISWGS